MPRTWYIPRWRHLLMQLIMWVVLGASVVVAAMLDQHLRRAQVIEFSDLITDNNLSFRFPADWKIAAQRNDADVTEHFATDTSGGVTRKLTILRQAIPHPMPPAQYIFRVIPISGTLDARDFKSIDIAGYPGQSIYWEAHRVSLGTVGEFQFTNCSAVIVSSSEAVMVRLDKDAPFDATDRRLYRQVIDQIKISGPAPTDGGAIRLSDGTSVAVPTDLRLYPQTDSLSTQAMVAQISDSGGWISAEFIPVAVPGNKPTQSLLEGLAAREQLDASHPSLADAWITADVSPQGSNLWTITPQDIAGDAVSPRRIAHLMTTETGWGLVVILSAEPPASLADLNHLWDELFAAIHLASPSTPLSDCLQSGASLAHKPEAAFAGDSWWVWTRGSLPIGFTHASAVANADVRYGSRYTVRRTFTGAAVAALQQWGINPDSTLWTRMTRSDAAAGFDNPLIPLFDETTTIGDIITTIVREPAETQIESPLAPSFVLSRSFPKLLSSVGPTPTAFFTDRFPGVEAELLPTPLLLLTRRLPGENGLICIQSQVNGIGSLAHWYFHAADQSLDHADFAGDLHLRLSTESEVDSIFAGDRRLTTQPH